MTRARRIAAQARGRAGEGRAALWLRLKGYRILARDWRSPVGEVDVIARRGATLVFVEVKARPSLDEAARAVGQTQQRRIARAAGVFWQARPELVGCHLRFDAILIAPGRWPRHIIDAWRIEADTA